MSKKSACAYIMIYDEWFWHAKVQEGYDQWLLVVQYLESQPLYWVRVWEE